MISLIVLLAAGAYIALWYLLVRALPNRWAKAFVALIAVYLPFWDVPYGYYNFQALCKSEGGLHVFQKVLPQTSIYLDESARVTAGDMFKNGFRMVEEHDRRGKIVRKFAGESRQVELENRQAIESAYGYRSEPYKTLPGGLLRTDTYIFSVASRDPIARTTVFDWRPWIQSLGLPFGQGSACPERSSIPPVEQLLRRTS